MLRKNYGYVRVDFAQPFSLKVRVWNELHQSIGLEAEDLGACPGCNPTPV
jgi:hypothetical protein